MIELQQVLASIAAFVAVLIVGLLIDRRDRAIAPSGVDHGVSEVGPTVREINRRIPERWRGRMNRAGIPEGTAQAIFVAVAVVSCDLCFRRKYLAMKFGS